MMICNKYLTFTIIIIIYMESTPTFEIDLHSLIQLREY